MRQFGIIFIFYFIAIFHGSNGSGFDFNPHEVIRKSRETPVDLDLGVRAAVASIKYTIPTSITGNGPDGLLQSANDLAAQADSLMIVLQSLLAHFNDTEGPEIEDVRNMTTQVQAFDAEYKEIVALINQINQMIAANANNVTYIEKQLTCMKTSGCNTGPTTPPPPSSYDCSVTTLTASKEGDRGAWVFASPTLFENCSTLTIKSQKGLWLNINVTMGSAGDGSLQIKGVTSGNFLFNSITNNSTILIDQADTEYSIIIDGAVTFSLNYVAVGVCNVTDCGSGTCSVTAANQPICACKPCYADDGNKKCSAYTDMCQQRGNLMCSDPSYCVNYANSTYCGYYCNCPDMPTNCPIKPLWCDGSTDCPTEKSTFDSRSFWKRHETFDEFDPIEFVQQAQESETTLNFTMPDTVEAKDPYILLNDATNLTNLANNLMAQLQTYLTMFSNAQNAPEWNKILPFENRLNTANATFGPLLDRFNDLKSRQAALEVSLGEVHSKLQCYQEADCHKAPSTTTAPPPPEYNCSSSKVGKVSKAGDSGVFNFTYVNQFNNCSFKIQSTVRYGLWINLQFSNLIFRDPASTISIVTTRDGPFTVQQNSTTFKNLKSDDITIYANGQLQFAISYNAIDPCAGYDCGNGKCGAVAPNNTQICACDGCYIADGNGRCTVSKPNPCDGNAGLFCTSSGGKCKETLDCGSYCQCPQLDPSCQTVQFCEDDVTSCPPPTDSRKMPSFLKKFMKFFNY